MTLWLAIDAQVKRFVICNCLNMDLLSHLPSSHHSSQSSNRSISTSAVNFLQTKNISLQIAKYYIRIKLIGFMCFGRIEQSKFKATKVIKQIIFKYFVHLFVSERKEYNTWHFASIVADII